MNKARRLRIQGANNLLEQAKALLDDCKSEEQIYFEQMPEAFQAGEKGQKVLEAIDYLTSAMDSIDSAVTELGNIE